MIVKGTLWEMCLGSIIRFLGEDNVLLCQNPLKQRAFCYRDEELTFGRGLIPDTKSVGCELSQLNIHEK